jgi:Family of unknown function (DUF5760)
MQKKTYILINIKNYHILYQMEKEELIKIIKDWVKIDNETKTLQKEIAKRRLEKKNITARLLNIMKSNQIDCFDINDGQILYKKKNIRKPITQKTLVDILYKYYDGDQARVQDLNTYIHENRNITVSESIVRKVEKNKSINTSDNMST